MWICVWSSVFCTRAVYTGVGRVLHRAYGGARLYLDELGGGKDGLVGHSRRRDDDLGVVLLLQTLIEHLHVEETEEAQPGEGESKRRRGKTEPLVSALKQTG